VNTATLEELEKHGFLRIAVLAPELRVADPSFNASRIIDSLRGLSAGGVRLAVFPELCLTGYTCGDLFQQAALQSAAEAALAEVAAATGGSGLAAVVGLPVRSDGRLFNCAALLAGGRIVGLVPKSFPPNSQEFYEARWFAAARALAFGQIAIAGQDVPIGADLLFSAEDFPRALLGIEMCEDLWAVEPPSGKQALAGASVLVNLSASNEILGKAPYRRDLVRGQSARCLAAYAYASSGPGESSTDLVFSGHGLIAECGAILAESERFSFGTTRAIADIDLARLEHERLRNSSFSIAAAQTAFRRIPFRFGAAATRENNTTLLHPLPPHPFVPQDRAARAEHCREILSIQSAGLAKRLLHTGAKTVVLGLSGGLDSSLAALVAIRALASIGRPASDLLAVIMPGPGSTGRTQDNAALLAATLGATTRTVPIGAALDRHLSDIGHPAGTHDVTFENSQARERTQILMDIANQTGGLVLGTGDLSELAIGWCTYCGDQMSMYHVNAGVPKTLVRHLIEWCADDADTGELPDVLRDIAATPITPELLPLAEDRTLVQKTEETVGPYELHDFFLFHTIRHGASPAKIALLARLAFGETYPGGEIDRWLEIFIRRFFANQFKRSAMPDGPKVGTVALSPRGDWRMPSDASPDAWLGGL